MWGVRSREEQRGAVIEDGAHYSCEKLDATPLGKGDEKKRWLLMTEYWASVTVLTIVFVLTTRQASP